ncbi:aspartyl protease family protein [Rhizorhabdus dicambivorans]|uniref:Uncharacterized protein n=1 Tax=Rhizorhabdus dicambivorans TaxID=1850238 RepID=A0A2A4FU51_9SPHN|nr:aspartyl protease family protein [Rhizorhabdus dicambivorans]ATE64564.1 hypothetical protein CMV14_09245 [Rhizorhabdus dicambivorans]PCE41659.1 hypothetical protein COO09_14170 [Rhizorhabdus dicambivorans]
MSGWAFLKAAVLLALALPGVAQARCALGQGAELPVTMAGWKPLVRGLVEGRELPFVVDSGALVSMLTANTAEALGLPLVDAPERFRMHGVGGEFAFRLAAVRRFELGGQARQNLDFLVGGSEADAAGWIGQNLLAQGDTEYDLGSGAIRFFRPTGCSAPELAYWSRAPAAVEIEPVDGRKTHIIATVMLNGQPLRAAFDTGAARTVISLEAAARAGFRPGGPGIVPGGTAVGLGQRSLAAWILPSASLRIGDEEIRAPGLRIADIGSIGVDMLIGADFFLAHRLIVANSQRRLYFSYNGGPVFDAPPDILLVRGAEWKRGAAVAELADGESYARRGLAALKRGDAAGALADFDRAVTLNPGEARYYFVRAQARLTRNEALLARQDLDAALIRRPDYAEVRLMRARLAMLDFDVAAARRDLEAASRSVARDADLHLPISAGYAAMEDWAGAIGELDLWIAAHAGDRRLADALNVRCWSRAMLNDGLPQALADCEAALRLAPGAAQLRDSRALVRLRMGDLAGAITDYDAALAAQPGIAWSLLGRGLAKRRSGREAEGKADIASAFARDHSLAEKALRIGLIRSVDDPR